MRLFARLPLLHLVLPDLNPAGDRTIRGEVAGKNVDVAVAVDVADVERREPRIAYYNRVFDEGRHPGGEGEECVV